MPGDNGVMAPPIDAVLFDLDDTLLDGDAAWRSGIERLVARCPGVAPAAAFGAWRASFDAHFDRFLAGELSPEEMRAARIRTWSELVSVDVVAGEELAWFAEYQAGYEDGWRAFADVRPALDRLAARPGLRLGVVTNGESGLQRRKLRALGLVPYFDAVTVSGDFGWAKPDRRIFERAAAAVGVPVERCLFVGDRHDVDVVGARGAGMRAVWLNRVAPSLDGGGDRISSLDQVAGLVGGDAEEPLPSAGSPARAGPLLGT